MIFRAGIGAMLIACWAIPLAAGERIVDSFEDGRIDPRIWSLVQATPQGVWITREHAAFGKASLALKVKASDGGRFCHDGCQRVEVREAPALWLKSGTDVWYGLSFRLSGEVPKRGSTRWVVGQWKQEAADVDPSPYLAQRFDNGVFHLTVEDNGCRTVIASAEGDYMAFLALAQQHSRPRIGVWAGMGLLDRKVPASCSTDIRIGPVTAKPLADPQRGWVRMVYRMRVARNDQGLVEVYADGEFIVRATGSIGYQTREAARQYFKIGHYRDQMPGEATLYFDCFVRSFTREEAFDTSGCGPAATGD